MTNLSRLSNLVKNLDIYPKNMKNNLQKLKGLHKSQNILLILIKKGLSREEGYEIIQSLSTKAWLSDKNFEELLLKNEKIKKYISAQELEKILLFKDKIKHVDYIFKKIFKI